MTDDSRPNFARFAWVIPLEEGQLGMLPEHRQRRRINAARRLARLYVTRKARELGMLADDWQESTMEGNFDASLAVRVSARFTAPDLATVPTIPFHDIGAMNKLARSAGIPPELAELLSAGPSSAEAFEAWQAPRRAAYEAARAAATERLAPAMAELGRLIEQLVNPPRYVTIDEEHLITAEQLEQFATSPGRMWITSTADEREAHAHALDLLEELGAVMAGMTARNPVRDSTLADVYAHHLDAIRRAVLHHHDLDDPTGAEERARARRRDH